MNENVLWQQMVHPVCVGKVVARTHTHAHTHLLAKPNTHTHVHPLGLPHTHKRQNALTQKSSICLSQLTRFVTGCLLWNHSSATKEWKRWEEKKIRWKRIFHTRKSSWGKKGCSTCNHVSRVRFQLSQFFFRRLWDSNLLGGTALHY